MSAESAEIEVPGADDLTFALERLRAEQSLARGFLFGAAAAAVGAAAWAVITVLFEFQIGWMAVGVGVLVGMGLREGGRGRDLAFGVTGAGLALIGCVAGNLLAGVGVLASVQHLGFLEVLARLNATVAMRILVATASPLDLLFYGLALHQGYKLSFRPVTPADVLRVLGRSQPIVDAA